jgi:hypothetical protein
MVAISIYTLLQGVLNSLTSLNLPLQPVYIFRLQTPGFDSILITFTCTTEDCAPSFNREKNRNALGFGGWHWGADQESTSSLKIQCSGGLGPHQAVKEILEHPRRLLSSPLML